MVLCVVSLLWLNNELNRKQMCDLTFVHRCACIIWKSVKSQTEFGVVSGKIVHEIVYLKHSLTWFGLSKRIVVSTNVPQPSKDDDSFVRCVYFDCSVQFSPQLNLHIVIILSVAWCVSRSINESKQKWK